MALPVGSQAPDFSLSYKDAQGIHLATLSDNFGKKNTLLLFFPLAFTGVCTSEMCQTSDAFSIYEDLQTKVYGISGDSPFSLEAWAIKERISVTLLSDYDHSVAKAYDVLYEIFAPQINLPLRGVAKRSAFIVDQTGEIQYAESSENSKQLPDFKAIRAQLQELA